MTGFQQALMALTLGFSSFMVSAATSYNSIEGYWHSIDERTGRQLAIIEVRKAANQTYTGKTVYLYRTDGVTHCIKCPAPYTNKPRLGLEFMSDFVQDPENPKQYTGGKILEPKTGKIYKGKISLQRNGTRLHLRGYVGISVLGRTVIWIRTDSPNP